MTKWFAVQCAPLKERLVVRQLQVRGIGEFWLHYLCAVRHGTRRGYSFRSWIKGYVFVEDGPNFSAGVVNRLEGVSTLLYNGHGLCTIPEPIIWDLKSMAEPDGLIPSAVARMKPPDNMVMIKGDNLIACLEELRKLKTKVWAKGMESAERKRVRSMAA